VDGEANVRVSPITTGKWEVRYYKNHLLVHLFF